MTAVTYPVPAGCRRLRTTTKAMSAASSTVPTTTAMTIPAMSPASLPPPLLLLSLLLLSEDVVTSVAGWTAPVIPAPGREPLIAVNSQGPDVMVACQSWALAATGSSKQCPFIHHFP